MTPTKKLNNKDYDKQFPSLAVRFNAEQKNKIEATRKKHGFKSKAETVRFLVMIAQDLT